MRDYNWTVSYKFYVNNTDGCPRSEHFVSMQIEAETQKEARKIALPIVKKLGGTIGRITKHNVLA